MDNISCPLKIKWKKKFAAARLATVLAIRWTGNRLFFMDSPILITEAYYIVMVIMGYGEGPHIFYCHDKQIIVL